MLSLLCDPSASPLVPFFGGPSSGNVCIINVSARTAAVCSGTLTAGWVMTIIVLSTGLVYLLGGLVYQIKVNNAEGWDRLPHASFWRELPGLVGDGCRYSLYLAHSALASCGVGAQPDGFVPVGSSAAGDASAAAAPATAGYGSYGGYGAM